MGLTITYIHGYLSSSQAHKATVLKQYLAVHYPQIRCLSPDFSDVITEALPELEIFCQKEMAAGTLCLVGSSMGGFMSTLLSIKFRLKACLFNPCVHPQNFVANLLGKEQVNADTGHRFFLQESLIDELRALDSYAQDNYAKDLLRIFLESGDEVLDYTEAQRFFSACPIDLTEGGAHRFVSFESKIEAVVDFFSKS